MARMVRTIPPTMSIPAITTPIFLKMIFLTPDSTLRLAPDPILDYALACPSC
jgi:hypothetical protein